MIEIPAVMTTAERHGQMAEALKTGFPFLQRKDGDAQLSIVCYGPSLLETWREIQDAYLPILTVSGAHDFLVERGITPTYHVHLDPRPYTKEMLAKPQEETKYVMATVCPSGFWRVLHGHQVILWHAINDYQTVDWISERHPEGMKSAIGGGSTVGQRAMNVGAALGYRRFRVFGMDCSFGYQHWAGPHPGNDERLIEVEAEGRTFKTTPQLWKAAREMCEFIETTGVEIEFHGDGLMQHVAKTLRKRTK